MFLHQTEARHEMTMSRASTDDQFAKVASRLLSFEVTLLRLRHLLFITADTQRSVLLLLNLAPIPGIKIYMATEFCELWNIPVVANPVLPYLHNPVNLGNYGTTAADVIINNALPDNQRNPLPAPPQNVPFDHNVIPWNVNPIDRNDLQHPIVIPANATVTNRNKLLALSKLFLPQHQQNQDMTFVVNRVGDTIYYLDGLPGDPPGPMLNANGQPAAD